MTREENLLLNLKENVFCKIGSSSIHGVGVFAIKDIPKGTVVFKFCNYHPDKDELVDIPEEEARFLDNEVLDLIKMYCGISRFNTYVVHENGLNHIHFGYYLNHSDEPNLKIYSDHNAKEYEYVNFITVKDIQMGQELTEDYRDLSGSEENLEAQYPFLKKER